MDKKTTKVLAAVALIIAAGVAAVEATRSTAEANPMIVAGGAAGYAGARVDEAFAAVSAMPPMKAISFALADKGDLLPLGCAGPFRPEIAAECLDSAYEVASEPATLVETRRGSTSILMRLHEITVAGS